MSRSLLLALCVLVLLAVSCSAAPLRLNSQLRGHHATRAQQLITRMQAGVHAAAARAHDASLPSAQPAHVRAVRPMRPHPRPVQSTPAAPAPKPVKPSTAAVVPPFVNPTGVITVPSHSSITILRNHTVAGGGTTGYWGLVTQIGPIACSNWRGELTPGTQSCTDGTLILMGLSNVNIDQTYMTAQFQYDFTSGGPGESALSFCYFRPWEACSAPIDMVKVLVVDQSEFKPEGKAQH